MSKTLEESIEDVVSILSPSEIASRYLKYLRLYSELLEETSEGEIVHG